MMTQPSNGLRGIPVAAAVTVAAAIVACSAYANLSFVVGDQRFFPPFSGTNANHNRALGAENVNIARSLADGQGFANPFSEPTGPTAWMPPVLPTILAGLWWVCDGDRDVVTVIVVVLQVFTLVLTGC